MQVIQTPIAGQIRSYQMLIGGEWVNAQSGQTFESINPSRLTHHLAATK